ncbi:MAG: single-stranded DNA-binding protein [Chloroflexi bacterium]|jgi:single-strand DNA-binding protein|nr:single-stranded DNA-binding protein [Chloroflexota bacterium]
MYQRLIIVGRLGRDPEMRYTPQGTPVTSLNVATDRSWTDQSGQRQERTTWFRVSVWGRQAESCNQYLAKGRMVLVEGEINEPQVYQRRDGEWAASLDVRAVNVRFLGGRGDERGDERGPSQGGPSDTGSSDSNQILDEEEIPF